METTPLLSDPEAAWSPYDPDRDGPWDRAEGRPPAPTGRVPRALARPWNATCRDGPAASVDRLLAGESNSRRRPARRGVRGAGRRDGRGCRRLGGPGRRLQAAWLYRMILTPHPLRERLTLFWHGHFATSDAKVNDPGLMAAQNALIRIARPRQLPCACSTAWPATRRCSPGSTPTLEPQGAPQRELRPRGDGALHPRARPLHREGRAGGRPRLHRRHRLGRSSTAMCPAQHDDGAKTILGQTGRFRGEDVARLLLDQPACADFLCAQALPPLRQRGRRPAPGLIAPLAEALPGGPLRRDGPRGHHPPLAALPRPGDASQAGEGRRWSSPSGPSVPWRSSGRRSRRRRWRGCAAGWGRPCMPRRASRAGRGARPGSTRRRCSRGRTSPSPSPRPPTRPSASDSTRWRWRNGTGAGRISPAFLADLLVQDAFDDKVRARVAASARGDARAAAGLVLTSPEFQLA